MATFNLGRILPNYRGNWESSYNYFTMDIVYYNGSSYVAKSNINAGNANPTINNNWQIIAMKGELSGNLTPQQQQAIIDSILNQGVVIDPQYNHTDNNYTNADKTKVQNIAEYSTQLRDTDELVRFPKVVTDTTSSIINMDLESNTVYVYGNLDELHIASFMDVDPYDKSTWNKGESVIYFTTNPSFQLNFPGGTYSTDSSIQFDDGEEYRLTFNGAVLTINKITLI